MASDGYTEVARGSSAQGWPWEVGVDGDSLAVSIARGPRMLLDGDERDRFAEAVARAVTPGQVTP
jgi:hypothetical protein